MNNEKLLGLSLVCIAGIFAFFAGNEILDAARERLDTHKEIKKRKLCQAYLDANLGWVKENAAVDQQGRYNFVHPDGTTCAVRPKAP